MMARRLGAAVLAAVMIIGAWWVRDQIDGAGDSVNAGVLVCATELVDACRSVAGDLAVVGADAGETLDSLSRPGGEPALWLTFDGFPQMLNVARDRAGAEPIAYTAIEIASSPISVVTRAGTADDTVERVVESCGDPIDLGCVGAQTEAQPAISPIDGGIGLLSVAAALNARAGGAVSFDDDDLVAWARELRAAGDAWGLASGSAVVAMQTRPEIALAIGAEAELGPAGREGFDVTYADPMVRARVVLLRPNGFELPDGLATDLGDALEAQGWAQPVAPEAGALPPPATLLAIREQWEEL